MDHTEARAKYLADKAAEHAAFLATVTANPPTFTPSELFTLAEAVKCAISEMETEHNDMADHKAVLSKLTNPPTTTPNRVTAALQTARAALVACYGAMDSDRDEEQETKAKSAIADLDAILQTTVNPEPLSDRAALQSILDWTDDSDREPIGDANARCLWYARRLLTIRQAARAALAKLAS